MAAAEYWFESHDGLKLFARIHPGPAPSAPVVLCLHGLMRNGRDFEDLALHLARHYRVLVPDVRGRGFSARDPQPGNYKLPVYVQDLMTLLAGVGAARVGIIGTSMGGLMALLLSALQPQLVAALVLNDIGPQVERAGLERIRGYAGRAPPVASWAEAIAQVRGIYGEAWPNLSDARWEKIARASYREDARGVPQADADARIAEPLRANADGAAPDLWPLWESLAALPVLAIRGAHSDILSAQTLERMQQKPHVTTLTVAARGHAPLLDEPQALAAIDTFLKSIS
jgi:pimeloyl-ACP methyl ester carboxylesterase